MMNKQILLRVPFLRAMPHAGTVTGSRRISGFLLPMPEPLLRLPHEARIIIRNAFPVTQRGSPIRVVLSCPISLLRWGASSVRCAMVPEGTMRLLKVFPTGLLPQLHAYPVTHQREVRSSIISPITLQSYTRKKDRKKGKTCTLSPPG